MRFFITLIFIFIVFNGCSRNNAFEYFGMDESHERAVSNMKTVTLTHQSRAKVIISAIYLKNVFPEKYTEGDHETFLVGMILEDVVFNKETSNLTLNKKMPVYIDDVPKDDPLRSYIPLDNEWTDFYRVGFNEIGEDQNGSLKLTFESGRFGTAVLMFQKDER